MDSMLSNIQNVIFRQHQNTFFISMLVGIVVAIIIIYASLWSHLKRVLKRFIRIQIHKRLMDPAIQASDKGAFVSYYQNSLCNIQKVNNEELAKILRKNYSSTFFVDRSISFMNTSRPPSPRSNEEGYASIYEFREKVPLTTYDDYRDYIDRIVVGGEKSLLSPDPVVYFNISSGTTGKSKLIPMTKPVWGSFMPLIQNSTSVMWRCLPPSLFPSAEQRQFHLLSGKEAKMFERSKNGIPIGPSSQVFSAVPQQPAMKIFLSTINIIAIDLIEGITDFETSAFVQLVFALTIPDLYAYTVIFTPGFIHTIKIIENYFEEISLCISSARFHPSTLVRINIHDVKLIADLNQALNEVAIEYGGEAHRLERAIHIREECLKKNVPGILHRLWPRLIYASTAIGGTSAIYKDEIQFYCGEKVRLSNSPFYASSEGFFGIVASIDTDEYLLLPTYAFFEFIKEEDVHQVQPETLLISEIEPGNRYELVCTTEGGLIRYRMGDMVNCTRYLTRADDLVPLPTEPADIPRIPLISIAYRVGNLLDIYGEKTTEQHVMDALKRVVLKWQEQGILVDIHDFTSYPKCDAFPAHYVIFVELKDRQQQKVDDQQLQNTVSSELEVELCLANHFYKTMRNSGKHGPLACILVRSGTFETFLNKELVTDRVSPIQIKPRRLLNNKQHIEFFYNHQITPATS